MAPHRHSRRAAVRGIFLTILGTAAFVLAARMLVVDDAPPAASEPFLYSFNVAGVLEESDTFESSSSEYWWLDSGGRLLIENGRGSTLVGSLPSEDGWRVAYASSNALDTEEGRYPQNLFRLLTQRTWENAAVSAQFRILADNETDSPNRNESNGLLLMSRYKDADNLYYAGVRVDGHAVIKKKIDGEYITLAEKPIFPGEYRGDNLLPHREWLSLKSETRTMGDTVEIRLFLKREGESEWHELLVARDTNSPILGLGHAGIRTDFMDVEFDDFFVEKR